MLILKKFQLSDLFTGRLGAFLYFLPYHYPKSVIKVHYILCYYVHEKLVSCTYSLLYVHKNGFLCTYPLLYVHKMGLFLSDGVL